VFVSIMGTEEQKATTMDGLASLAGHLRGRIGRSLKLRAAPQIEFQIDASIARAARIESLLSELKPRATPEPDGGSDQ
jgi:ribosome-binding factor A